MNSSAKAPSEQAIRLCSKGRATCAYRLLPANVDVGVIAIPLALQAIRYILSLYRLTRNSRPRPFAVTVGRFDETGEIRIG